MASIGLYLDKRIKDKNGASPVKLVIRNKGTVAYKSIGVSLPENCWSNGRIKNSKELTSLGKSARTEEIRIRNIYNMYEAAYLESGKCRTNQSAKNIMADIVARVEGNKYEEEATIVSACRQMIINKSAPEKRIRKYTSSVNSLKISDDKLLSLPLKDWTNKSLISFRDKLMSRYKPYTVDTYLQTIRAIYNYAKKTGMVRKDYDDTFEDVLGIRIPVTARRNIPISEFRDLWNEQVDLKKINSKETYKYLMSLKLFKLSFCLCGINIADLYRLKKSDIINGRLETLRRKTGVRISVRIEPETEKLIEELSSGELLIGKITSSYRTEKTFIEMLNRRLSRIRPGLTSYYARHTWATLAFDLDIPDHVIAMGLSHEDRSGNTNHFYINNDLRKLDRANRRVLDYVEGKIEID